MTDNFLEIKKSIEEIKKRYAEDPRQQAFNALILGEHGSGKTFLLRTARKPVHIDSFDPGGSKGLRDYIEKGEIVVDARWEAEDPLKPFAYDEWRRVMEDRIRMGYFDHFGTYCLDGSTTWSEAIMNKILKRAGIAGDPPRWAKDYVPQKIEIRNWLKRCLALPCDFILTGHLEGYPDDVTGGMSYRFMTTGKGTITIPLNFDEIYVMSPRETSKGVEYRILTEATGRDVARSRLSKGGKLGIYEKPDLKEILKKAGMSTEDKPLFK